MEKSTSLTLTLHATHEFINRSGRRGQISVWEAREHMRYLLDQGEEGVRNEQPAIFSQGWVFMLDPSKENVVTAFLGVKPR